MDYDYGIIYKKYLLRYYKNIKSNTALGSFEFIKYI